MPKPMFQRRQYVAIADILADAFKRAHTSGDLFAVSVLSDVQRDVTHLFKCDNHRFSPERFAAHVQKEVTG